MGDAFSIWGNYIEGISFVRRVELVLRGLVALRLGEKNMFEADGFLVKFVGSGGLESKVETSYRVGESVEVLGSWEFKKASPPDDDQPAFVLVQFPFWAVEVTEETLGKVEGDIVPKTQGVIVKGTCWVGVKVEKVEGNGTTVKFTPLCGFVASAFGKKKMLQIAKSELGVKDSVEAESLGGKDVYDALHTALEMSFNLLEEGLRTTLSPIKEMGKKGQVTVMSEAEKS